jgi:oxygen-independent coproporphyrinogen-3 oxidase
VSADLIFGVYGQTAREAADEVAAVADLGVQHLSAYALTIEPGTQFGTLHKKGRLPLLPEETAADCFNAVRQALTMRGFEHYEISNYSKPGHAARHNVGYWQGRNYLGIGCGAWGTLSNAAGTYRYKNTVSIDRYLSLESWPEPSETTTGPGKPQQDFERLGSEALLVERLMLGLRLARGLHVPHVLASLGLEHLGERRLGRVERLQRQGKVSWDGQNLSIPAEQWLFADGIIAQLA